ncbi:MAG: M28 family peptidase, partial [Chitinophagaceae bacterium]
LFVTEHPWAKEVGLAINFEARGSSGPGYMLMETTKGNAKMIEGFTKAGVKYPAANSLMYSIYKMLPNDTDLTVFREEGDIQGFNFAFIDNHFNYHTQQDTYEHLSPATLAHQGTNLMPLLQYFSNADLRTLESAEDHVYFNVPFGFWSYSFSWIWPILLFSMAVFIFITYTGIRKNLFSAKGIVMGFLPFLAAVIGAGLVTFSGWKLITIAYPAYADILHGFTYNGHAYIGAFTALTMAICFLLYRSPKSGNPEMEKMVAPLFLWIVLNAIIAFKLKGAGFLIIPVIAGLLMVGNYVRTGKSNPFFNTVLVIPALVILAPFIKMFPVGLGLNILFGSSILTVLSFTLLLPVFGSFDRKNLWSAMFLLIAVGLFVKAHLTSGFKKGEAKPNSLVYVINKEANKSYWATYDKNL